MTEQFICIVVMWFEYRINKKSNLVFVASFVKIIEFEDDLIFI